MVSLWSIQRKYGNGNNLNENMLTTGGQVGQSAPLDSEKFAKNREKEGENKEKGGKERKNWEKEEKSGRFFHLASPDR